MRANVYSRYDREVMVSKYSQKLARLYKAQVDLYKLIHGRFKIVNGG